jgi:glycosyltransferase involved in cell wall biosynthesis
VGSPPKTLRVLQVLATDATGGTELMVVMLARELRARGVEVEVALLRRRGPISERLRAEGVPTYSLEGLGATVGSGLRLARLLRGRRYDLINAYGFKASMVARVVARVRRPRPQVVCGVQERHVTETEDVDSPKARLAGAIERRAAPLVDVYEANSTGALDVLQEYGIDRSKLRYVPNGIEVERWPFRGNGSEAHEPLVICIARFVARKRQIDLVHAAEMLTRRGASFRIVMAGVGPSLEEVRAAANNSAAAERLEFPGEIARVDVVELCRRAAVFVLPSTSEGMPASLMEAMALGVPVIGTAVNGISDLIEHEKTGLLVPPCDPSALAAALERLLEDRELGARLAAAARRRIEERHSLEAMITAKEALYQAALAGPASLR